MTALWRRDGWRRTRDARARLQLERLRAERAFGTTNNMFAGLLDEACASCSGYPDRLSGWFMDAATRSTRLPKGITAESGQGQLCTVQLATALYDRNLLHKGIKNRRISNLLRSEEREEAVDAVLYEVRAGNLAAFGGLLTGRFPLFRVSRAFEIREVGPAVDAMRLLGRPMYASGERRPTSDNTLDYLVRINLKRSKLPFLTCPSILDEPATPWILPSPVAVSDVSKGGLTVDFRTAPELSDGVVEWVHAECSMSDVVESMSELGPVRLLESVTPDWNALAAVLRNRHRHAPRS